MKKLLLSRLLRSPPFAVGRMQCSPGGRSKQSGAGCRLPGAVFCGALWAKQPRLSRRNVATPVFDGLPPQCAARQSNSRTGRSQAVKTWLLRPYRACANHGTRHRLPCSAVSAPGSRFRIPGSAVVLSPATRLRLRLRRGKPATGYRLPATKLKASSRSGNSASQAGWPRGSW